MPTIELGLDSGLIRYNFDLYAGFMALLEPHVEGTLQDWTQAVERQAQQIKDEDERSIFYEFHSEEYAERQQFRYILMNSFFSASFALFEHHLLRICENARRRSKNPFSVKDLKSSSATDNAKEYLRKLGVGFPSGTSTWEEITKYRTIRNKIMHEGGSLPRRGSITDYAKQKQIASGGGVSLELTRPFCEEALDNMKLFLLDVQRTYDSWRASEK